HRYSPFLVKGSPAPAAPPRPADPDPPPLFPCPLPRSRPTCAVSPPGPPEDAPGPRVGLRALAAPTGGGRGGQRGARAAEASGLRGGARHGGRVREAEPARIPRHALHSEAHRPGRLHDRRHLCHPRHRCRVLFCDIADPSKQFGGA
ncbi:unnamed protein product, partial [Prorocentrum cordatum]